MPKSQKPIKSKIDPKTITADAITPGSISVLMLDPKTGEQWGETLYADGRVVRTPRRKGKPHQNPPIQTTENT